VKGVDFTATAEGDNVVTFDLGGEQEIGSLHYLPQQGDDRKGLVANYEIYAGMEKDAMQRVAEGEFSNIRNNPVMQEVFFTPTHCRYVQLRATRMVNAGEKIAYQQVIIR